MCSRFFFFSFFHFLHIFFYRITKCIQRKKKNKTNIWLSDCYETPGQLEPTIRVSIHHVTIWLYIYMSVSVCVCAVFCLTGYVKSHDKPTVCWRPEDIEILFSEREREKEKNHPFSMCLIELMARVNEPARVHENKVIATCAYTT